MALPSVVGTDKVFTTSTTVTVPVPAGTANGDTLIMYIDPVVGGTTTTPAGWTLLGTNESGRACFWRTASSEPASYNVTVSYTTTAAALGAMIAWRNYPTGWLTGASHKQGLTASSTTMNIGGTNRKTFVLHDWAAPIQVRTVNKQYYTQTSFCRYRNTAAAAALTVTVSGGGVLVAQYDDTSTIASQAFGVAICYVQLPHRMHPGDSAFAYVPNVGTNTIVRSHVYGDGTGVDDIAPDQTPGWAWNQSMATPRWQSI